MPGFEGRGGGGHHYGMGPVSGPVLPGGDIGDGVASLPEAVRKAFEKSSENGEEILAAAASDLSPDGQFGSQHVFASKTRLFLAVPNGLEPELRSWPLEQLKKANVDLLVGQASFVAQIGKERVEVCRFTNSRQREFHRLAALVEELARKGELPDAKAESKDLLPRYCARCSRLLPEPGGACPACLKRGQVLMRLLGYLRPHWKRAALLIATMVVSALIETLPPYLTKVLIDDVIGKPVVTTIAGWDTGDRGWSRVTWLAIIVTLFLISRLLLVVISILGGRQATWLGPRIVADLRGKLYGHLQRLSLNYFDKSRTGALISRVTHDTAHVQGFLVNGVPHVGIDLFLLFFIGAILFTMNWQLTLAILVPLPIVIYVSKNFWRFMRSLFGRAWARSARLVATLNDSLNGIRVVKAFGQEEQEIARFGSRNWDLVTAETRAEMTWATFFPAITFLTMLGQFIIWYVGGSNVIDGTMTLGTLLAFFSYLGMFYRPIQMIARVNEWLTRDLTAAERVFEILDTAPDVRDKSDATELSSIRGEIRFENVRFGYDPLRPVLKGISLDIQPGEMIGLVGRSGAGKTTIINMICRFYDPQEGVVRVDGIDLKDLRQEQWHRFIGIVPQEPFLFHGTITENIAYAKPDATKDEIIRAARAANAHQFIVRFPDGYDTQVGERGTRLSGGERQRISIARAILHDPKILILDEATSSVDTETEQQIQDAIARLVKGRTVFAIAHRLSTLKNAHRLLVIEDGQVVEFGTHDELLLKEGVYAKLVNSQRQLSAITAVGG